MADRKIEAMYRQYGKAYGCKCADCPHLIGYTQSRTWYKCAAYGLSHSAATDWAKRWEACGLFGRPLVNRPMIEMIRRAKRTENQPCDGQIDMFGGVDDV